MRSSADMHLVQSKLDASKGILLSLAACYSIVFLVFVFVHLKARQIIYRLDEGDAADDKKESEGTSPDTVKEEKSSNGLYTYETTGGQMTKYDIDLTLSWKSLFFLHGTLLGHPEVS
eukprot:TRINITY_DN115141_c0_g1_i1.p1 TRINITY_DN115141_c0_g1~~TRINITY_DN115141_c0_g1_i1.p1  ORF type:complete len:117 (+),score=22.61 TRINITY_DN115141_c0_g1_i1:55-405(+)